MQLFLQSLYILTGYVERFGVLVYIEIFILVGMLLRLSLHLLILINHI